MNKILSKIVNPRKKIAGLDIGVSSVKFMEIEGDSLENAKLVCYAVEPIPREYISHEGRIENLQGVADVIKACWKKSGSRTKNVVIALPSSGIINKKAIIPNFDNQSDLKDQVEAEISRYFPEGMNLEDVALDYYTMQPNELNPEDNDMLLVASKKDRIEERTALVEMAGLVPQIIEVEQYSIQNLLRLMQGQEFNEKTTLLVECAAKVMRMYVFRNGQLIYSKDSEFGGDEFTRDIMNNMGVGSVLEAEKLKVEKTGDETFDMIEKTFLMNYSSEFLRAFQYYATSNAIPDIDEVVLCGGVAGILGIEEAFRNIILENGETHIKGDPYVARPLQNIAKADKISLGKFSRDEAGLFLVTSLAFRHLLRQY
jgi:type IV pilus assembly protein PilM